MWPIISGVERETMKLVVSRYTHEHVVMDMPGFAAPRRTLFGRYDYGQVPLVVVDLVIDQLEAALRSMDKVPRRLKDELMILQMNRDPNPPPL